MQNRTYFNLDQKQLFKPPKVEKVEKDPKVKKAQPLSKIIEEPQKQIWDINVQDGVAKCVDTIGNKKKKDVQFFKPGASFIKEKTEEQKEKTDKEINKEIHQVIRQKKNEFFEELKEENRLKEERLEKEKKATENQADQVNKEGEENQVNQEEKENLGENITTLDDGGLLKKKIGKYKKGEKGNYVRLDLNKQYQDRFRGALFMNQRRYKKNGTLKNPPQTKREQNQIDFQLLNNQGQSSSYNIFIQSVSSGLRVNIFENDENVQEQEKIEAEIKQLVQEIRADLNDQEKYVKLLQLAFGYEYFREGQLEGIQSILRKESMLIVQKTGHGKSLVYQYLSLFLQDSIGVIFSPLISLMVDQVQKLPDTIKGIAYHSMLTSFQKDKLLQYIQDKQVQLIYCTPEIFQSELGFCLQSFGKIQFICIDEAHCVSELSHSYRHTYIILDQMIKNFLKEDIPPYLALTATATQLTIKSIMTKFQIQKSIVSIDTERPNIEITVSRDKDVNTALIKLLTSEKYSQLSSIIIFCRSRYMVDVISNYLRNSNLSCQGFHGALTEQEKMDIQNRFIKNQTKIIVATTIFAMGIDKQDIRAIIHLNLPKSIEAYVQEIGRAGRDGQAAYAHLFLRELDFHLERSFVLSDHPDFTVLSKIVEKMKQRQDSEKITYFITKFAEENFDTRKDTIYTLMQILEKCSNGCIKVFPICYERILLRFYKSLGEEVKSKSPFLQELNKLGKVINGNLIVNVIRASNELQMQPLEVIRQARNLFTELHIKTEVQEEILPFQIMKPLEEDILERANQILQMHKGVALDKLNLMYMVSYENSIPNVELLLKQVNPIRQHKIFNLYFQSEEPVKEICNKLYGDPNINLNEYLPFDTLDSEKEKQIQQAVKRFLFEETSNKTQAETKKLTNFYLKNPKILAKLFCGIQSIKYSYKEYKNSSIWNKSGRLSYEDVHSVILKICLSMLPQ